jgi:NTE family protein
MRRKRLSATLEYVRHPVSSGVDKPGQRGGKNHLAVCLSGGGLRAALFHLGALRRLNELGILRRVDTVASVSGGSILAAFLARDVYDNGWPIPPGDWDKRIAGPFHGIAASSLLPWVKSGWALPAMYDKRITRGLTLACLKDVGPRFRFCATDLNFGVPWVFSKEGVGNALRGYVNPLEQKEQWTVADAVSVSSCFPPLFSPMNIDLGGMGRSPGTNSEASALSEALLNDGGVIDNFGIETVRWTHRWIIVSDGGSPLRFGRLARRIGVPLVGSVLGWGLDVWLSSNVANHQSVELNKRWLNDRFRIEQARREAAAQGPHEFGIDPVTAPAGKVGPRGTYFGISSAADGYGGSKAGFSRGLAERSISRIRTDLNAHSEEEWQILENHAYSLAEAASQEFLTDLLDPEEPKLQASIPNPHWWGASANRPVDATHGSLPQPDADTERHVAAALSGSHSPFRSRLPNWRRHRAKP